VCFVCVCVSVEHKEMKNNFGNYSFSCVRSSSQSVVVVVVVDLNQQRTHFIAQENFVAVVAVVDNVAVAALVQKIYSFHFPQNKVVCSWMLLLLVSQFFILENYTQASHYVMR